MVKDEPKIKRGEIWIADLNPGYEQEIHKKRPVVIISNDAINKYSPTLIILPVTSRVFPLGPEKILLSKKNKKLHKKSAILILGIRNIDRNRLIRKISYVDGENMIEIEDGLKLVLELKEGN